MNISHLPTPFVASNPIILLLSDIFEDLFIDFCRLLWYKEPTPEPVGDLERHLLGRVETQKLIFMAPQVGRRHIMGHSTIRHRQYEMACHQWWDTAWDTV
jgi:hypothetical protein